MNTLLYACHSASFNQKETTEDPSPFMLAFDQLNGKEYLFVLFNFIPHIFNNKKLTTQQISIVKSHLTLVTPIIFSCPNWHSAVESLEPSLLHSLFLSISTHNSSVITCDQQILTLFNIIISNFPTISDYFESQNSNIQFIISLLFYFQNQLEKGTISFLHTIILASLSILTTKMSTLLFLNEKTKIIFPTKTRILSNTVGDLIIEILTNVVDIDLEMSSPVLPLINTVIANISSTTVNISKFSAVRLYDFLRFYFSSKISERTEFNSSIEKLLISIFNLTRIQTFSNHNLLLKGFEELILLEEISNSNVETWREIVKKPLKIINAAEMPLTQTTEAKEKSLELHNAISPILAEYSQIRFLKQVEIITIKRNPTIIYDWFRVMFWELIPGDTVKYNLLFSSFYR